MADHSIQNFGVLLNDINRGALLEELNGDLLELLEKLRDKAVQTSGKVSGTLQLKLKFSVTPTGLITVDPDVSTAAPKPIREQDSFHLTSAGGLSRRNERQQDLPLREVSTPVEIREAR